MHKKINKGISLVEMLVGIVISLLTVLAITQAYISYQSQQRLPASLAKAQTNGILALDSLQRDIRGAGYGFNGGPWVGGCTSAASTASQEVGLSARTLNPVTISMPNGQQSNEISVFSSGKIGPALQVGLMESHPANNSEFVVSSTLGFEVGDWILVAAKAGNECEAVKVSAISDSAPYKITTSSSTVHAYARGSLLLNMGLKPVIRNWSISGADDKAFNLQMLNISDGVSAVSEDVYPDIVMMRALYAKDADGDGVIDNYSMSLPSNHNEWGQTVGVRLVLVVRVSEWSKDPITTKLPQWNLGQVNGVDGAVDCVNQKSNQCINLDISETVPNDEWQNYRYQIYDSMIPLRNLIWRSS